MNNMNIHGVTEVNILDGAGGENIWKSIVIKSDRGSIRLTLFPKDADKMFEITEGESE